MQHAMLTQLLGDCLFWAPIGTEPQRVPDLGAGTGVWTIDFADMFPTAEVIGTDLSAIQLQWLPPNLRFQIDDAEGDWTWQPESFDYIYNRNFICAIRDWPKLIKQSFEYIQSFPSRSVLTRTAAPLDPAAGWNGTKSTPMS